MTTLAVYYDDIFLEHDPPAGTFHVPPQDWLAVPESHPDRPERIRNIRYAIEYALSEVVAWKTVTPATRNQLERVHDGGYLDELERACTRAPERLTPETGVSEATFEAARHAAGAAIQTAACALETGPDEVAYAPVRPSGHHAQPSRADGYCYVNNVAIAAAAVREADETDRIAILDWDVHHGNGTQEIFYDRSDVLTISLHNDFGSWGEYHPQTGGLDEIGRGDGVGYNVNVPLPPGTGDHGYAYAFERIVEPVVTVYDPDLLLVSAGQDAGHLDPMARNLVTKNGFEDIGRRTRRLAATCADGSLGVVQEGGYQASHLAAATLGVLEGMLGVDTDVSEPFFALSEHRPPAEAWIEDARETHAEHWPLEGEPSG